MVGLFLACTGKDAELPNEKDLLQAGVGTFETAGGHSQQQSAKEQISKPEGGEADGDATTILSIGVGLPAIPKKLVAKILPNEYVDFM